jgi:hypothetical protein
MVVRVLHHLYLAHKFNMLAVVVVEIGALVAAGQITKMVMV